MIPRPVRGLLFVALALALVIPPALAQRGGRGEAVAAAAVAAAVGEAASWRRRRDIAWWRRDTAWRRWGLLS